MTLHISVYCEIKINIKSEKFDLRKRISEAGECLLDLPSDEADDVMLVVLLQVLVLLRGVESFVEDGEKHSEETDADDDNKQEEEDRAQNLKIMLLITQ